MRFVHYCLFVVFFPQLIAGPIVHHQQVLPQFSRRGAFSPSARHLSIGITIFALGLFKKVVIADALALDATPVFDAAVRGEQLVAGVRPGQFQRVVGAQLGLGKRLIVDECRRSRRLAPRRRGIVRSLHAYSMRPASARTYCPPGSST